MRGLLLYAILSVIQSVYGIYVSVYKTHCAERHAWVNNSINVFMLLEFLIFTFFILTSLFNKYTRLILKIVIALFVASTFRIWISTEAFDEQPAFLTLLESYLIIIGCLLYYLEILYLPLKTSLIKSYNFWAITGMLLLFIFLIPLFLPRRNIYLSSPKLYNTVYPITFIGYIILFIFFSISLKWKIKN
jgi:hypothetical protein